MKRLTKAFSLMLALMLCVSVCPAALAVNMDYAQTLFDRNSLIEIDIQMDDEAWEHMIATASEEEYSACDLVINGVLYENVGIRPKGNSSRSSVSKRGSERFSWRINFNKYEDKLKCDGLDTLILNNGFNDPGEFREAIAYDMYAFLGADASLYNYAVVYRIGEYFGVYLTLEGVDKTFLRRNYGKDYGKLYKPELSGDGSDFVNFPIDTPFTVSDLSQRGFFMALLEDETYLAQYHEYLRRLCEEYVLGGGLEEACARIRGQIDALVAADPTAFCTYDQFDAAASSLKTAIELRAQSVLGQLSGEIPSTREGQEAAPDKLLDVSSADLSGLTGHGGWGGNDGMVMPERKELPKLAIKPS